MQHLRPRKQNRFDILQSSISYYQGSEGKRTLCPQNVRVRYAAPHLRLHSAIRILQNSFYPGIGLNSNVVRSRSGEMISDTCELQLTIQIMG